MAIIIKHPHGNCVWAAWTAWTAKEAYWPMVNVHELQTRITHWPTIPYIMVIAGYLIVRSIVPFLKNSLVGGPLYTYWNSLGNWNSALLYFKLLFRIGVWTFACFVRLLLATVLCIIGNLVPAYTCIACFPVVKKFTKKRITAPILKPTGDQKPETFLA